MHIYFSGIGGTGIGPLALIAKQAGFEVSGSDKQDSDYIHYLQGHGIDDIHIGQSSESLETLHAKHPIDWFVYSSALPRENPDHPELLTAERLGIKMSKRDEFLNYLLQEKNLKLIAVAGTHGKTTTTAMVIWLFKELGLPVSYSVGGKLSFGEMGEFDPKSEYFVYEADEYDRNFLSFHPYMSIITGIGWDHPDVYPTSKEYVQAFRQFLDQSEHAFIWQEDADRLGVTNSARIGVINKTDYPFFNLTGKVNRENAAIVAQASVQALGRDDFMKLVDPLNRFPGVSRRFERIAGGIYSDYAHTPEKIRGALQVAHEAAGDDVVVVYEGLHNTRQHFIREELKDLFDGVKKLYVVPSYLAREDESLEPLTPEKLCEIIEKPADRVPAQLDERLKLSITEHVKQGSLILCLTAGGGGSLDEWLRQTFTET